MTVTSQLTNITLAETGDSGNWDDIGGGPGSAQDDDSPIQGTENRGRRIDNNTARGFGYDVTTPIDMSGEGMHVGFWIQVLQPGLIGSNGLEISIGDSGTDCQSGNWDGHYFTAAQYEEAQVVGGWIRIYLWANRPRDAGSGTLNYATGPRNFGSLYPMGDVGGTTPNTKMDRIDYTTAGVRLHGGTGGTPTIIQDIVDADSGNSSNRYGFIVPLQGKNFLLVRLTIEDVFTDAPKLTGYKAPLCSKDFMGVTVDLEAAGDDCNFSSGFVLESSPGHDRQMDFQCFGTAGAFDTPGGSCNELRRIKLTSACTLGSTVFTECGQIDPTNGRYEGFMDLPGTNEYVDTQESISLDTPTGDFEIIMRISADDWTPAAIDSLAAHYGGTAATTSFRFQLLTTGALRLIVGDGASTTSLDSSVLTFIKSNGTWLWVRVTYDQSAGQASFFESLDPRDTPSADIEWTAAGTPTGTSRSMAVNSRPLLLGAENDGTPTAFFAGRISYFELWTDGFKATGASLGDLISRADWRTGPAFAGSTRVDDFDVAGLTWEEQGTSPAYTASDDNSGAADMSDSLIVNSVSESALHWNVNTDPNGELDNMSFTSSGTGHAIEFGPNTPVSITLTGHEYSGYAGTDGYTGNETIFNNTGDDLTINITDGATPSIRNGTGASTTVNVSVSLEINGLTEGSYGVMIGVGGAEAGVELLSGYANASGIISGSFGGTTPQTVTVRARNSGIINAAIQEEDGVGFTDFTNDARDATGVDDVDLLPATISVDDAFYFGGLATFAQIEMDVTTIGDTYVLTWEYWNGAWTALTVTDATNSFTTLGWNFIDFTAPSDWATTTINSQGPFYYVRARVTTGGGTQPQAEEISLNKTTKYLPFVVGGTIASGTGLTTTAVWTVDTNAT